MHEYTRCLAVMLRPYGVTANAIAPGDIVTPGFVASRQIDEGQLAETGTLERYGRPIDVARAGGGIHHRAGAPRRRRAAVLRRLVPIIRTPANIPPPGFDSTRSAALPVATRRCRRHDRLPLVHVDLPRSGGPPRTSRSDSFHRTAYVSLATGAKP